MSGHIALSRDFFKGKFWNEKRVFSKAEAWLDLVKEARFEVEPKTTFIKNKPVTWGRGQLPASLRFLGERWGWTKDKVSRFLDFLRSDNAIRTETASETGQTIITLCNYDTYNPAQKSTETVTETVTRQQRDKTNKVNNISKDIMSSLIETIIEYLNKKTGRTFGVNTAETIKLISKLLNDGKKVEDFFAVIDTKSAEWINDPKMKLHLQPSTLFGNKFERYLEQSQAKIISHPASTQQSTPYQSLMSLN